MASLKGQNLRIYSYTGDSEQATAKVLVAMATNCTITLTGNTDDATHKDIVGNSPTPTITTKSWQIQVESLDVTDMPGLIDAIVNTRTFDLMWNTSYTTDNQTATESETLGRTGKAYMSDISFVFNDRQKSTKSITLTGTGAISKAPSNITTDVIPVSYNYTMGQYVRLFLGSDNVFDPTKVIAAAKDLTFHIGTTLEDATTKDTTGEWQIQEPTALTYDISTSALVKSYETITSSTEGHDLNSLEEIYENAAPVKFFIANVLGDNQRTILSTLAKGSVLLTQLTIQGPNRQNATYQAQLSGFGPLNTPGIIIERLWPQPPVSIDEINHTLDPQIEFISDLDLTAHELWEKLVIEYYVSGSSGATNKASLLEDGPDTVSVLADVDLMFKLVRKYDDNVPQNIWMYSEFGQRPNIVIKSIYIA